MPAQKSLFLETFLLSVVQLKLYLYLLSLLPFKVTELPQSYQRSEDEISRM
jgi:hypothetical protein